MVFRLSSERAPSSFSSSTSKTPTEIREYHETSIEASAQPQFPTETLMGISEEADEEAVNEETPLLSREPKSNGFTRLLRRLSQRLSTPNYRLAAHPSTATGLPSDHISPMTSQPEAVVQVPWLRDVLKATAAFMLACSFTFIQPLHDMLGFGSSLAAVAVLTFHPCKSYGAMLEATVIGFLGVLFGTAVSAFGLWLVLMLRQPEQESNVWMMAALLSLIFLSTFYLAFIRARSMRATVYTGTIMAHIVISTILTNVNNHRIQHFDPMLLWNTVVPTAVGIAVSLAGNWFLWPVSATTVLRAEIARMLYSFEDLIHLFTASFLLDGSVSVSEEKAGEPSRRAQIESAMSIHHIHAAYLSRANQEAKLEFLSRFMLASARRNDEQEIVESMSRLTQHVGGMKSGILKEDDVLHNKRLSNANVELLQDFLQHIRPALVDLGHLCRRTVQEVNSVISLQPLSRFWQPIRAYNQSMSSANHLQKVQFQLREALQSFTLYQKTMLASLYEKEKFDGKPNDELFLVYFFVFCIMEFTKELDQGLVQIVKRSKVRDAGRKPWGWFWCFSRPELIENQTVDELANVCVEVGTAQQMPTEYDQQTQPQSTTERDRYFQFLQSQTNSNFHKYIKTPTLAPHKSNVITSDPPVRLSAFLRHRLQLWRFLTSVEHSYELKYALKTACIVSGFASLAFVPETRSYYQDYYGHWAILSTVVTMTPTVGGTNTAGLYRILGTLVGAGYSYLIWNAFPNDPVWLMSAITIFAAPCFYIFLYSDYPRLAQVMLLTVCATVVANYANRDNPSWQFTIWELAWKRAVVVIAGIVAGLLVTWYVWPYEARVELRKGLSDLFINMGILYSRLVEVFNHPDGSNIVPQVTMQSKMLSASHITPSTIHRHYYQNFDHLSTKATLSYFLSFELKLQQTLMRLSQLMPLTRMEPRLKGPFPVEVYKEMLQSCQNILDKFVAMRVAIANNVSNDNQGSSTNLPAADDMTNQDVAHSTLGRQKAHEDLILGIAPRRPTSAATYPSGGNQLVSEEFPQHPELLPFRRELVGSVLLCFYIYSSSLTLKQPLPTYLPPARAAKKRLLERIHQVIVHKEPVSNDEMTVGNDKQGWRLFKKKKTELPENIQYPERYINYYAYALSLEDVIVELEKLGFIMKKLFGEMFADVVQIHDDLIQPDLNREEEITIVVDASTPRGIPPSKRKNRFHRILEDMNTSSDSLPDRRRSSTGDIWAHETDSLHGGHPESHRVALSQSWKLQETSGDERLFWRSNGTWMV